jgi:lactate dehydrogenase-like 2-hydroxyacid dehydrogenase
VSAASAYNEKSGSIAIMPNPRIYLTRHWPREVEARLSGRFDVTVNETGAPLSPAAMKAVLAADYAALGPNPGDRLTGEVLEARSQSMKLLANYGVGVSHIDLKACERLGIVVTNTPDVLTESTAETAVMLMLMAARRAGEGERQVRGKAWTGLGPANLLGTDVSGRKLGVIGFGRIGQAMARKAYHGFGMQVSYYSRHRAAPEAEAQSNATYCASLEELLPNVDFVSVHCPGGAETHHLIDGRRLSQMKRTAFLINTARGEVVDETALIEALRDRTIAGAGLDVYEREPTVPDDLIALQNVVLLPHIGSATVETRIAMGMRAAENLERFFAGLEPTDRVA